MVMVGTPPVPVTPPEPDPTADAEPVEFGPPGDPTTAPAQATKTRPQAASAAPRTFERDLVWDMNFK
jgi:hypothetical protein